MTWEPPGKDCGACGLPTCSDFIAAVRKKKKINGDCTFFSEVRADRKTETTYAGTDVTGVTYDFIIRAFPGEPSARKFIVPFRADLVERWEIKKGDLVTGRPAGPGCPIYHALRVLSANPVTGVLECHTVGPLEARKEKTHDVQAYHVHAFEGIAETVLRPPTLGLRQRFLPGYCMINLAHTALVNMVLRKKDGLHVRVEDIRIL
ncbi:(Fe-S)-binding protein [Methanoregula sp.]|uniref:(Fe-S)-binding protein n=1 Tax=Methanoregula sp. TaxID=2052170 RepID=UPI00356A7E50